MSDRLLKVFISSTSVDLQEHRKAVAESIRRAGEFDINMKYFGSRPDDPKEVCYQEIEKADVLVGIYAMRYGWIPEGEEKSITELEFDHAKAKGIPCLCYVIDDKAGWPLNLIEYKSIAKLDTFKEKINKLVRSTFTDPANLASQVMADLYRMGKEHASKSNETSSLPQKKTGQSIPEHFYLTCNRAEQIGEFRTVFFEGESPPSRLFFYLYGDAKQMHQSLAKRFGYETLGKYLDSVDNLSQEAGRDTKKWIIRRVKPQIAQQYNASRINLLLALYEQFGLDLIASQRCVADLYKSLLLQHFTSNDTVVVVFSLDQWNWHSEHTPALVRYFVTEYCQGECPADAPRILFFFGIEYEKEKTTVREQVKKAIDQSHYGIRLPELEPVTESDVEEWFSREDKLIAEGKDAKYMRGFHFGDFVKKDMAEVELILKKITDEFNKNEC